MNRRKETPGKRKSKQEGMIMNPTLATLLTVSVTVIAATLVLILIFLIPVLLQIRRTAREAEKLIDSVRLQVAPVSHDVVLISRDVKSIVQSVHRQVNRVEDGIETVHEMAVRVKQFQRRTDDPLLQLAAVLGGVKRGVEAIADIFCR
ncbi:MAG: DUF948 domain-containing protein [Syntrophales bacterium]